MKRSYRHQLGKNSVASTITTYVPFDTDFNDVIAGLTSQQSDPALPAILSTGQVSNAFDNTGTRVGIELNPSSSGLLSFSDGTNDVPFSMTFAINWASLRTYQEYLISKWFLDIEWVFIRNVGNQNMQFVMYDRRSGTQYVQAVGYLLTPTLNQWYHFTITHDGNTQVRPKMYVNGVLVAGGVSNPQPNYLGMVPTNTSVYFGFEPLVKSRNTDTKIDEFYIAKGTVWTDDEILSNYNKFLNGQNLI